MTDELQGLLATAASESARDAANALPLRRPTQLHAVAGRKAMVPLVPAPYKAAAPASPQNSEELDHLGRRGLRLGFWLCGFHEALLERQRNGGTLTEREKSLLELSRRDFADMQPLVVSMAIERLCALVASPGVAETAGPAEDGGPGFMELFVLETLRNMAVRARTLLRDEGPDAAMSMFSGGATLTEPLAIFQAVFATAAGVIDAFEPLVPNGARTLKRIAAALDSELDRT